MDKDELRQRTKAFGLRVLKLVRSLPKDVPGDVVGRQLARSALSVGANYRSACRSRSRAEFLSKLGVVLEEVDESGYWLEIVAADKMLLSQKVSALLAEANELTAIFSSSIGSIRKNDAKELGAKA